MGETTTKNCRASEIFILKDSLNTELFADIAMFILQRTTLDLQMTVTWFYKPQYDRGWTEKLSLSFVIVSVGHNVMGLDFTFRKRRRGRRSSFDFGRILSKIMNCRKIRKIS